MKRELKPNYQMLLNSYVTAINTTLDDLAKAKDNHNRLFGVNQDGTFWVYAGYEERAEKIKGMEKELVRLIDEMQKIKEKIESEKMI